MQDECKIYVYNTSIYAAQCWFVLDFGCDNTLSFPRIVNNVVPRSAGGFRAAYRVADIKCTYGHIIDTLSPQEGSKCRYEVWPQTASDLDAATYRMLCLVLDGFVYMLMVTLLLRQLTLWSGVLLFNHLLKTQPLLQQARDVINEHIGSLRAIVDLHDQLGF